MARAAAGFKAMPAEGRAAPRRRGELSGLVVFIETRGPLFTFPADFIGRNVLTRGDVAPMFRPRRLAQAGSFNNPRRTSIRRPNRAPPTPQKEGPRINRDIRAREVQLIDAEGQNRGKTDIAEALRLAEEASLDLVEIVPNATPPVCKILDYGRFRFLEQKKAAEARKKQKVVEIKEIKLRPGIDDHDYEVKMKAVKRFFEEGDKVKITLRFRGREMAHTDLGYRLLMKVREETAALAKVEAEPSMEGRQMIMVLAPK